MKLSLEHGDLTKIALKSGLSVTTVRQWIHGNVELPAPTQSRIMDAYAEIATDKESILTALSNHVESVCKRVNEFGTELKDAINNLPSTSQTA